MDKTNKKWIIILTLVCALSALAWAALSLFGGGTVAVISVDGEEYRRIDLSRVDAPYSFDIDTKYGHNTVHVSHGAICISDSDCPDHICMNQGEITKSGIPIVCMPHRLVISIEGGGIDA